MHSAVSFKNSKPYNIKMNKEERKEFKCDICEYEVSYKSDLICHIFSVHAKMPVLKCDQCEYSTTSTNNLTKHTMSRHAEKKFKCDRC